MSVAICETVHRILSEEITAISKDLDTLARTLPSGSAKDRAIRLLEADASETKQALVWIEEQQ